MSAAREAKARRARRRAIAHAAGTVAYHAFADPMEAA
jgi:hypothetical protein